MTTALAAALPVVLWAASNPLAAASLVVAVAATLLAARRGVAVARQITRDRRLAFEAVAAAARPPVPWRSADTGELAESAGERSTE